MTALAIIALAGAALVAALTWCMCAVGQRADERDARHGPAE